MAKITPKGKKVTGTNKKDKITWQNKKAWQKALNVYANGGNDVINFAKSKYKNKIYGGKGDDTITAGKGNNTVYFNKGDGKDTVLNGGGVDTLVFSKETKKTLKAKISGKNIILTGKKGKNTVILKNLMNGNHSAQYVTIGKKKVKVETLIPVKNITSSSTSIKGSNLRDKITSTANNAVINALDGDDTITVSGNNFTINTGKGNDVINITSAAKGTVVVNKGDGNLVINGIENAVKVLDNNTLEYAITLKSDAILQNFHNRYYIVGKSVGDNFVISLNDGATITINNMMKLEGNDLIKAIGINCKEEDLINIVTGNPFIMMLIGMSTNVIPVPFLAIEQPNIIDMGNKAYISVDKENTYLSADGNINRTIDFNAAKGVLYLEGTGTHNVNILSNSTELNGEFYGKNNVNLGAGSNMLYFYEGSVNNVKVTASSPSQLFFAEGSKNIVTLSSVSVLNNIHFNDSDNIVYSAGNRNSISFHSENLTKQNLIYSNGDNEFIYNSGNTLIDFDVDDNHRHKQIYVQNEKAITEIKNPDKASMTLFYDYEKEDIDIIFSHYYNQNANNGDDYITLKVQDKNGSFRNGETKIWGNWTDGSFNLETLSKDDFCLRKGYTGVFAGIANGLTQYVDMEKVQNSNTLDFNNSNDILGMAKDVYIKGTESNDTYTIDNIDKQYVISEIGGSNDTLIINQDKSNFRVFVDVKAGGGLGDDIYIISTTGENSEFSKFIKNQDANYILLKNANLLASAEIDKFKTATQKTSAYGISISYIDDIKDSVASWLSNYNSSNGKAYGSVMEAIQKGAGDNNLIAAYTTNANSIWNNSWENI